MNVVTTQASYVETIAVGLAGQIVNMREFDSITRTCEPATLGFGVAVCQGAEKTHGCAVGGAIGLFLGVTIRDITLITAATANIDKYEIGNNVGILTTGEIWVPTSESVAPGDPVAYSTTTGVFSKTAGAGVTGPMPNARWMSGTQNGLARLHLMVV